MALQPSSTASTPGHPHLHQEAVTHERRDAFAAIAAVIGLALVFALAFLPAVRPTLADKVTLLFLSIVAAILFWTPLFRLFELQRSAATFALTAAMFIVYSLARQAGPQDGLALRFASLPDDPFYISYAARVVIIAALLGAPSWLRYRAGAARALLAALGIMAALATLSALFLGRFYEVSPAPADKGVDSTLLPFFGLQVVEYGAVVLLCNAVCAYPPARRIVLRVLPLALLVLWARHQFIQAPPPPEDEE